MRYCEVDARYKVDIISFLRNYIGISGENLKQNRLTHDDIKVLFPNLDLVRIPYIIAYKNPEMVYNGEYLIVYDANQELIVYKNPSMTYEALPVEESNYEQKKEFITLPSSLQDLSKEELLKLRSKVRKIGEAKKAKELTNEIRKKKKIEPLAYKRAKRILRENELEEEDYYENYKRR